MLQISLVRSINSEKLLAARSCAWSKHATFARGEAYEANLKILATFEMRAPNGP